MVLSVGRLRFGETAAVREDIRAVVQAAEGALVVANDIDPDGAPLTLVPTLVEPPDPAAGLAYVTKLIREHTTISPTSGRDATAAFAAGQGDVLLSYESEALMLRRQNRDAGQRPADYVIPPQTFRIDLPVATVETADDGAAARAFTDFLFTPAAQRALPATGFRPTDPAIAAETAGSFPERVGRLWTVDELGARLGAGTGLRGWPAVDKALFSDAGAITAAYRGRAG